MSVQLDETHVEVTDDAQVDEAPVVRLTAEQRAKARLAELLYRGLDIDIVIDGLLGDEVLVAEDSCRIVVLLTVLDTLHDSLLAFCVEGRS